MTDPQSLQPSDGSAPVTPAALRYEPGRMYRITVLRVVEAGPLRITPKHGATVLGAVAETFRDAIATAEPAPASEPT